MIVSKSKMVKMLMLVTEDTDVQRLYLSQKIYASSPFFFQMRFNQTIYFQKEKARERKSTMYFGGQCLSGSDIWTLYILYNEQEKELYIFSSAHFSGSSYASWLSPLYSLYIIYYILIIYYIMSMITYCCLIANWSLIQF